MEYHYIYLTYKVPASVKRYYAIETVEEFIYDHLNEFGCLPRDENVKKMTEIKFGINFPKTKLNLMIRLTDEQAIKSASDRSEYHHPSPVKIDTSEKKNLRKMSKRKRSMSEDEPVHKKRKDCRCPICLEDMDTKKNITLECDCVFHYACIKRWLGCKKVCPTCEKEVNI